MPETGGTLRPLTRSGAGRRHAPVAERASGWARACLFSVPTSPALPAARGVLVDERRAARPHPGRHGAALCADRSPGLRADGDAVCRAVRSRHADRHGQSRSARAGRAADCRRVSAVPASRTLARSCTCRARRRCSASLVWVARDGTEQALPAAPHEYDWPRLSPDGKRVAVEVEGQTWIYDIARDTLTRLTFVGSQNDGPLWTPDGAHIVNRSNREGPPCQPVLADGRRQRRQQAPQHVRIRWPTCRCRFLPTGNSSRSSGPTRRRCETSGSCRLADGTRKSVPQHAND